jgi:hypothetical protein
MFISTYFAQEAVAAALAGRHDDAADLLRQLHDIDADIAAITAAECYGDSTDWIWECLP